MRHMLIGALFVLSLVALSPGAGMKGNAMAKSSDLDVTCKPAHAKVRLPDTLCPLFQARLRALRPGWAGGDLTLVVGDATARSFMAHIEAPGWQGDPRAAMLSGGQLSEDQIIRILDELIAGLPGN
ncbi:hypothetical protein RXV86_21870 [Alisedimentitalea sp. MJ-SS2]|uniref:hypothetical protein n=1 Tax=Aliisedimentitalea sp. MJ-SS2 TaxID=3049795 RepID=UPI0029107D90|nr:hypothetical protein [Alisedimentitalea sp. MJ-SS2]MDU8930043.1 hypothetical protein [Alisedimentitalea sp. MJ-SS2]